MQIEETGESCYQYPQLARVGGRQLRLGGNQAQLRPSAPGARIGSGENTKLLLGQTSQRVGLLGQPFELPLAGQLAQALGQMQLGLGRGRIIPVCGHVALQQGHRVLVVAVAPQRLGQVELDAAPRVPAQHVDDGLVQFAVPAAGVQNRELFQVLHSVARLADMEMAGESLQEAAVFAQRQAIGAGVLVSSCQSEAGIG